MVNNNVEKNGVIELRLEGVDIPPAGVLADLLQEWVSWTRTYGSLLEDVGGLDNLHQKTIEVIKKWGRDG